jgi:adenosylmethionine-8-amino-7-oxononanoate aminotransferase
VTHLWHPFADMSAVERDGQLVLVQGSGASVFDADGSEYLDLTAGLWFANVGHGRTEIADAMGAQAGRLAAYSTFGDMANEPVLKLADRLAAIAPVTDSKVFFTSGGSDAVDTAAKLVRRYWTLVGHPQRTTILTRDRAYHGMHWGGTAMGGIEPNRAGYGEWAADVVHVGWDSVADLEQVIHERGAETIGAFFCEPVMGAGGVHFAGEEYLQKARALCREHGVLWVSDEVITGYGRTGEWFASTRFQLEPDLVLSAKGLTSGYAPMGAVLVAPSVAAPFWDGTSGVWRHGYTYSGHAVAAAAAMANLDVIEREGLIGQVLDLEPVLTQTLGELVDHPLVSEVRSGVGLLAAVQIDADAVTQDAAIVPAVVAGLRARGVLTRPLVDGSLQVSPPFVVTADELKRFAAACWEALQEVLTAR